MLWEMHDALPQCHKLSAAKGLSIVPPQGHDFHARPAQRSKPLPPPHLPPLLLSQALDCLPALRTALPHLAPASRCVLLQNGMPAVMRQLQHHLGPQLGLPPPHHVPPSTLRTVSDPCSTTSSSSSSSASASCHVPPRTYVSSVMHGCYVQGGVVGQGNRWNTAEAGLAGQEGVPSFAVVHAALGGVAMGALPPLLAASERLRARQLQCNRQGSNTATTTTTTTASGTDSIGSSRGNGSQRDNAVSGGARGNGVGQVADAEVSGAAQGDTGGIGSEDDDGAYLEGLAQHLPGLRIHRVAEPGALLSELYTKMAANCIINFITALLGCRNGQLMEHQSALCLMRDMCGELVAVYGTEAFALPPASTQPTRAGAAGPGAGEPSGAREAEAVEALYQRVLAGVRVTARHHTSMLQDVLSCRPTEVDYLVGHVAACAEERGVDAPVHRTLAGLVGTKQGMYPATWTRGDGGRGGLGAAGVPQASRV